MSVARHFGKLAIAVTMAASLGFSAAAIAGETEAAATAPLTFTLSFKADAAANVDGGAKRGGRLLSLTDLAAI